MKTMMRRNKKRMQRMDKMGEMEEKTTTATSQTIIWKVKKMATTRMMVIWKTYALTVQGPEGVPMQTTIRHPNDQICSGAAVKRISWTLGGPLWALNKDALKIPCLHV